MFLPFFVAILFFLPVVGCLLWIGSTEQQSTTPRDVALWDQVVQADQFFLLSPLLSNR